MEAALQRIAEAPDGAAEAALADAEALRFPMSVGSLRDDADKRGGACGVVDVVVSDQVAAAAGAHRPFKAFLIDLILGHVGKKHGLELDLKYKLPKMGYKGGAAPEPQRIKMEKKPLVREVTKGGGGGGGSSGSGSKAPPAGAGGKGAAAAGTGGGGQLPASGGAGAPGQLRYSLDFEGRPVTAVEVTVQLPAGWAAGGSSQGGAAAADFDVQVCGQEVFVSVPGCQELSIQLPVAVSAEGAEAVLLKPAAASGGGLTKGGAGGQQQGAGRLQLRLPYQPLRKWVDEMAAATPHAFDKLPVAGEGYMELE